MNSCESFSRDYQEARSKFREQAAVAGGAIESMKHPDLGPDGGDLSTDIAWFGPAEAAKVLVLLSGTHGVEGFCGSGAQVDWLRRGEAGRLPKDVALLMVHAVNPWGFAWLRRGTEENVDLNRNWIAFEVSALDNPEYDQLASAICPTDWTGEARRASDVAIARFIEEKGWAAYRNVISRGQYRHPLGICYGGSRPTWSRLTQSAIFDHYLRHATSIAIIDYHTGRGPWGYGELIVPAARDGDTFRRAAAWYGTALTSPFDGNSPAVRIGGGGLSAAPDLLSHAAVTPTYLEVGTQPFEQVFEALRADAWLHAYGDPGSPQGKTIKSQVRTAFYGDADDWKGMVIGQSLLICTQALYGLSRRVGP